ncbi:MAG: hypothetical protein GC178_18575 [Flavobacteriales bacterium]|nr:hypothetical protein [Flavobacteriales bacterium]
MQKEIEEVEQLEESLRETRLALKENVRSIREVEARLRRLKSSLARLEAHLNNPRRSGSPRPRLQNPIQQKLNSLPLEERQAFLLENM